MSVHPLEQVPSEHRALLRGSGFEVWVSGFGFWVLVSGFWFLVVDFVSRASGVEFWGSSFELHEHGTMRTTLA